MRTTSPAPYGSPTGLAFGSTEDPYSAARPHKGFDHEWRYADPDQSKETFASVSGTVTAAFNDGGWHDGWGNYVDVTVPTTDGSSVVARLAHHATGSVVVHVGDVVTAGQTRVGTMGKTGDSEAGVHLHEEIWINGVRVDPIYYRTHDIPGTAPSPSSTKENDMTFPITIAGKHRFHVGPGFIKHFTSVKASDLTKNIITADDKWIDLSIQDFADQLDSFGIPRNVVDGNNGGVLNPATGKVEAGGMWSWDREASVKADRILAALSAK